MKKKGLIVATIVMVLVLAVSITTATYAWFTTEAVATIESIAISATAASDVQIGMKANNKLGTDDDPTAFVSGTLTTVGKSIDSPNVSWAGDPNMAFNIVTDISLANINKAVGTGTAAPVLGTAYTGTIDGADVATLSDYFVKASGDKTTFTNTTVDAAVENTDYLHFVVGMQAIKADVDTITFEMRFSTTGNAAGLMGVSNGLHVLYRTAPDGTWTNIDLGGEHGTAPSVAGTYLEKVADHMVSWTDGVIDETAESSTETAIAAGDSIVKVTFGTEGVYSAAIYEIEVLIYYMGQDTDCRTEALGSSCSLSFAITNTNNVGKSST